MEKAIEAAAKAIKAAAKAIHHLLRASDVAEPVIPLYGHYHPDDKITVSGDKGGAGVAVIIIDGDIASVSIAAPTRAPHD